MALAMNDQMLKYSYDQHGGNTKISYVAIFNTETRSLETPQGQDA